MVYIYVKVVCEGYEYIMLFEELVFGDFVLLVVGDKVFVDLWLV